MSQLIKFSMKNVAAVFILILLLLVGGVYSATSLKMESMPDISFPVVAISTGYTAPPKDVLEQVTKPLEKAVSGLDGLKTLTSTSADNMSTVLLELDQSKDTKAIKQDVESLISSVKLPTGVSPKVSTFGFASSPVYYLAMYGENNTTQTELDKTFQDTILPALNGLKGVDHLDVIGDAKATVNIKLDANALQNYGLTPSQVVNLLKASLTSSHAGTVDLNGKTEMVRVMGHQDTIYNLENMPIMTSQGNALLLKEIGKIEAIDEAKFIARLSSKPAIGVMLYKTKDTNNVQFAAAADKLLADWKNSLPNVSFQVVYNAAVSIKQSINGMLHEGILGAILASLMILVFLRNFRMTLIVLVSIPLSILITLIFMSAFDITLNIMTLGGIAIAIGRVVDDSIVVIENIYSQLVKRKEEGEGIILFATKQVASAITSSTITTVGVFGPIAFVSGVVGEVFKPFALTIVCAIMSSLLVALTVIPMLSKLLVLRSKQLPVHDQEYSGPIMRRYKSIMSWSLTNPKKTLLMAFLLFVTVCLITVPVLPKSFMPNTEDEKTMAFLIKMPQETTFDTMNLKAKEIERNMMEAKSPDGQPVFKFVESLVGYDAGINGSRVDYKTTVFTAVPDNLSAKDTAAAWQKLIGNDLPQGSTVDFSVFSFGPPAAGGADFIYNLKGNDDLYLEQAAKMVKDKLKEFPELKDVKDSLSDKRKEVQIKVDENKAQLYGLNAATVLDTVNSWIAENNLGDIRFDNVVFSTNVMVDMSFKDSVQKILDFTFKTQTGATIKLGGIAKVQEVDAPTVISNDSQKQTLKVSANIDSKDKGGVSAKVSAALDALQLPPGVFRETKGVSDDIQKSFGEMFIAMFASIFIVYMVMVLAFGNVRAPLVILFSLPLAAIGGLLGLLLTGESINVTSLIGFLMLIGIVVTNAIVLVDRVQQLREEGYTVRDALLEAGMTRLRPIIMTAVATIISMLPLALGLSKGAYISKGLAIVVIGGLTTSTLLTLIIVPIIYEIFFHQKPQGVKELASANTVTVTH